MHSSKTFLLATLGATLAATVGTSLLAAPAALAQPAARGGAAKTADASKLPTPPSQATGTPPTTAATAGATATPTAPADAAVGEDDVLYKCGKAKGMITPSFKPETELKDLITWAMGFTCKNFVYDSSILGRSKKVTIISPNKMSAPDAYRLFLNALSTMGVTVVPVGNTLRIVESGGAKGETVRIVRSGTPSDSEEIIRFIFRPSYTTAETMNQALSVVKSKDGVINVIGGTLLVTDYSSAIRDMVTLSRELDKPAAQDGIYTIKIEHADAKELQAKLSEILGVGAAGAAATPAPAGKGKGKPAAAAVSDTPSAGIESDDIGSAVPSKILVDERTNTLIVVASEAGYLRVRGLAKRLDIAVGAESAGSIHVYSLENANAEEMAQTLNAALGSGTQTPGRRAAAAPAAGRDGATQPTRPTAAAAEGLGATLEGQVRVTADPPTNSLVVVATGRDFVAVRDVIRKLDVTRRQVYIEAVILEIKLESGLDLGVSAHGGVPVGDGDTGLVLGGVQMPQSGLSSLQPGSLISAEGLVGGLIGAPLSGIDTLFGSSATSVTIPSYGLLFQALATSGNVNILSSPTIMALDNEESQITVGESYPYKSTAIGLAAGAAAGLQGLGNNIQREKLTLDMKITPHISANNNVRLELDLNIKARGADAADGPIWTERAAKTKLVVADQQSAVIGGLVAEQETEKETKVPILGDIPILGYLFKYRNKTKSKTNLLMLLTPYVVKDQLDLQVILDRKARERDEFVRSFSGLSTASYLPSIDYGRKRGLVEEINRTVLDVEREAEVLRALDTVEVIPEGRIEYQVDPGPEPVDADAPAPAATTEAAPAATPGAK